MERILRKKNHGHRQYRHRGVGSGSVYGHRAQIGGCEDISRPEIPRYPCDRRGSGEGGDEGLAGYERFNARRLDSYYRCIPRVLREKVIGYLRRTITLADGRVVADVAVLRNKIEKRIATPSQKEI